MAATFNSGFRFADARGGYLGNGHTVGMLRRGAASVVMHADGTATVGQWGRDVALGTNVVAVRQNLDLVVDGGHPVPGLMDGTGRRWGSPENRAQYTWRSGLGVDSQGDLVYVGGANLNLAALADALVQAGVTHGMQLDMHHAMVDFLSYPNGATARSSTGVKLLAGHGRQHRPVPGPRPAGLLRGHAAVTASSTVVDLAVNILDARSLLTTFGIVGIFVVLFAETGLLVGFFLPGDSLLFTAGLLSSSAVANPLPLPWVLVASAAGALSARRSGI